MLTLAGTGTKIFSGNVTVASGASANETGAGTITLNGNLTVGGTWNNSGNAAVNFSGSLTNNGTFTSGTGLQTFTGTGKTIGGSAANVTITNLVVLGTITTGDNLTVGAALVVNPVRRLPSARTIP